MRMSLWPRARRTTPAHNGKLMRTAIGVPAATVWLERPSWQLHRRTNCKSCTVSSAERTYSSYEEHVELAKKLDAEGKLPATFMVVAPGSWSDEVWDDINRMRTLNTTQSQRRAQMHVCPLQLDIVERLINRYSNPGDTVFDPFAGLFTVPKLAVDMGRRGVGVGST
ncbi:MAG: DNA methyltransferase [Christensenellales bacterium]